MKYVMVVLLGTMSFEGYSQNHKLEMMWQTDSVVAIPESVLPDAKNNTLYISLIDGAPWAADGKGGIGKLSPNGKSYNANWITGLNAPKGMGIAGNWLYVADMNEVVMIDLGKGKIAKKLALDSAQGLNDVTVTGKGIVYVSDSRTGKIWRLENEVAELYLSNINGINGLKAIGDDLFIGAGKSLLKADKNKVVTKIAELPQGIDGIEPVGNGDFILTSWSGYVFYVSATGAVETLLETHQQKKNTADIGYDPAKRILYVPTFFGKTVAAYKLL
ncbi:MAG TPA: hypothetical protein VM871_04340 [Flavisolibacter sp.]|nr:hypothetical protein [Flavisolibacter sp.]